MELTPRLFDGQTLEWAGFRLVGEDAFEDNISNRYSAFELPVTPFGTLLANTNGSSQSPVANDLRMTYDSCRRLHRKCSGGDPTTPCNICADKNVDCVFNPIGTAVVKRARTRKRKSTIEEEPQAEPNKKRAIEKPSLVSILLLGAFAVGATCVIHMAVLALMAPTLHPMTFARRRTWFARFACSSPSWTRTA